MKITDNTTKTVSLRSLNKGDVFLDPISNDFFIKTDQNEGVADTLKITCVKLCNGVVIRFCADDTVLTVKAEVIIS